MSGTIAFTCEECGGAFDVDDISATELARCEQGDLRCDVCVADPGWVNRETTHPNC
jgi:hypothetical protein